MPVPLAGPSVPFADAALVSRPNAISEGTTSMAIITDLSGKTAVITGSNSGIGLGNRAGTGAGRRRYRAELLHRPGRGPRAGRRDRRGRRRHRALHQGRHVEGRRMPRADRKGRGLRHPRQQRGHPACRRDPRFPGREMGCDHRDQPQLRLSHHGGRPAPDARRRLGPRDQYRLGPWPDGEPLQGGIHRGQARDRGPDQDDGGWRPRRSRSRRTRSARATS